jgi:mRNA-degrading endonuclease toxin of MazEF toxin-antitoxin module
MTNFSSGDVVLVKFIFADEQGVKQRPALIVSSGRYHKGRQEAILAAVTSNVGRLLTGDHKIKAWREAGLLFPSTVTGIVRTIKQDMIIRKIGALKPQDFDASQVKLRECFAAFQSL